MEESEIRKKLAKKRKDILENSRKMNEQLDKLRLEDVKKVAKEIADVFPKEVSKETFEQIVAIIAKYQKKNDDAIQKLFEMESQKRIIELQNTDINDPDWWAKASAAKMLGITIPGMEESMKFPLEKKRTKSRNNAK